VPRESGAVKDKSLILIRFSGLSRIPAGFGQKKGPEGMPFRPKLTPFCNFVAK
jgi:hypothetical protein